jgi:hypothetical protein
VKAGIDSGHLGAGVTHQTLNDVLRHTAIDKARAAGYL